MIVFRGYFAVALANPRDPKNVAHALRACGAFGSAFLAYSGARYKHSTVDTQKAYRHMPLIHAGAKPEDVLTVIPHDCVPIAVEIAPNAKPLESYTHPERAIYIMGPEDGSLHQDVMDRCKDVVRIRSRYCLNLAAAVNVVLYDRSAKGTPISAAYEHGRPLP
jgi:tRNA(Leu) C34 or U34 (ribose-2'-O)-methylase TrmL